MCGIDSLYLSFKGQIAASVEEKLRHLKELAQSERLLESSQAFYEVNEHKFEVKPKGAGKFAFVLDDNWFNIQLSGSSSPNMPLAYVQIKSELLTFHDLEEVIANLFSIIRHFDEKGTLLSISRLDLCMDFYCLNGFRIEDIQIEQWKTRAVNIDRFHHSKKPTGWRIGKGDILTRLYNKTLEIKKSKKDYLKAVWENAGWGCETDVWRLEFQFRQSIFSEILKQRPDLKLSELIQYISPSLWQYGAGEWLQLVEVNPKDSNPSRWPVHPAWQEFIEPCACGKPGPIKRVRKERLPHDRYLFLNGLGAISSFMAREGISDLGEAFGEFFAKAEQYHYEALNGDIETYLHDKALEKTKRYNTTMKE